MFNIYTLIAKAHAWWPRMRIIGVAFFFIFIFSFIALVFAWGLPRAVLVLISPNAQVGTVAAVVTSPFRYTFKSTGTLKEASSEDESSSPYFWLDSGAKLIIENGIGRTLQGKLSELDPWHVRYALSSRVDTSNGDYPQNLFRLLTRSSWENVRVDTSFRILADHFVDSPNQNASNGLLLMLRYTDGNNLYYAGIRMDGTAVIKKKYKGTYYTLAQKTIFSGRYAEHANMNLLPHDTWISLRTEIITNLDGSVGISLYQKTEGAAGWTKILEAKDAGTFGGTMPITGAGFIGIRTDFMDVAFKDFNALRL